MRGGFSTMIVHSILFIAAAVAAYLFVSSMYKSLYDVQGAMVEREKLISDRLKTVFDIDSCTYDGSTLSMYLTNRGTTALDPYKLKVFVDGILVNVSSLEFVYVVNNNSAWERYETIKVDVSTEEGTKTVKVVASNGAYTEELLYITGTNCTIL